MTFLFGGAEDRNARKRQEDAEREARWKREEEAEIERRATQAENDRRAAQAEIEKQAVHAEIDRLKGEQSSYEEQARQIFAIVKPEISAHAAEAAPKWEYLVHNDISQDDLDSLGAKGWELVAAGSYEIGGTLITVHTQYVFKRPRPRDEDLPETTQKKIKPLFDLLDRIDEIKAELKDLTSRLNAL